MDMQRKGWEWPDALVGSCIGPHYKAKMYL
jgi:hypothetical protein